VPPWTAADLLRPLDAEVASELAAIPSAPLAVVAIGYAAEVLPSPLDGFGFLVPRGEGLRMLGCLWDSSIFRFRAPVGRVLVRLMISAHDPGQPVSTRTGFASPGASSAGCSGSPPSPTSRASSATAAASRSAPGHGARLMHRRPPAAGLPGVSRLARRGGEPGDRGRPGGGGAPG
jgi:hypothetical protein